ncbi:MAG: Cna B-type domain-containing protein, partial [Firmicutes bacterium]|nr:Cna B-type domain-containing protein [Bacillota bacterium]
PIPTTRVIKGVDGQPILDDDGKIQTETVNVNAYYFYDEVNDKEYIMPIATPDENVSWDLSPLSILKDGFSYEVRFVVWPNQDAYDLVADLNNGKRPDIEATGNWENCELKTDSAGQQYRQGGFPGYPYISRYEDSGVYAAMSNTEQKVDYYKFDQKIVNGEEVTVIIHDSKDVLPPDPMPLTAAQSRIEKQWNVERDRGIFAQYLYNTDGSSKGFQVDFDIFQGDNLTDAYKTVTLGWVYDKDNDGNPVYLGENESGDYVLEEDEETGTTRKRKGHYVWVPGDTMTNVTYAGYAHSIGTCWANDFSIATGLMLTEGEMDELGLNKSLYVSCTYPAENGTAYYILEPGHDYTIKEHQAGTIGYEFDFSSPVYHPMLVDGVLKNVEIEYTYKTDEHGDPITDEDGNKIIDTASISSITGSETGLSGLKIENTLRGYINLDKVVVDEDNESVESDDTKFEYTITLNSPITPGPFTGDHIPWYGIGGLYYNDGNTEGNKNYYQVYEAQGGVWKLRNENGDEYVVISTGFDPVEAGVQTVTYRVSETETKTIELYGNQTTPSADGKTATATLTITQNETLSIANVPVDTAYTITESTIDGYELIGIVKEVKNGSTVESSQTVTDLSGRIVSGTIITNRNNHITFTNQIKTGALKITKTIQKNGSTDTSATGTFYYAAYYGEPYDPEADPPQTPALTGHIDVAENGYGEFTEEKLRTGAYYVYELTGENGTPVVSGEGGIFNDGKYYSVTTAGSPAEVEEGQTAQADIVNNYETIPVTATKSWADNNPQDLTVYFKLFYVNAGGVDVTTGTPLKPLVPGATSVTWTDIPKYDADGNEYNYIVREYVLDEQNGEFTEDSHKYTEAAPNGYVNTEAGLTVTNTKLETYEPVTTYSGLKLWVDTVNGSLTRPDGLEVTLMIDKTGDGPSDDDVEALDGEGNPYQLAWVTIDDDEWRYTFHNLPMFDNDMQIIRYYAVETPAAGYTAETTSHSDTQYVYVTHTLDHTDNDAYPVMNSDADLVYTAVRIQHEGYLHHIWTQRIPTAEEKTRLVQLVNADLTVNGLANPPATVDNVHWVSGLPINHEFVWKAQPNGYKVAFTRYNTNTIHVEVNNHRAFSNICYGTLQYNYTAGSVDFKNTLDSESYSVEKTWGEGSTPPDGAVVTIELKGTVPGTATEADPDPAPVPVDLASLGMTQNIEVTLNGGREGGDDTEAHWKYSWTDLPQYDKASNKITYHAVEKSYTIDGKTVDLTAYAPVETGSDNQLLITNQTPDYSFEILKIDSLSAATLPGAQFTLQAIEPTSTTEHPSKIGDPSAPVTTASNGRISFDNVALGYYEIEEVESPSGYVFLNEDDDRFYVRVDAEGVHLLEKVITDGHLSFREAVSNEFGDIAVGNVTFSTVGNSVLFTVENTSGAVLPYTGGAGAGTILLLGVLLLVLAGAGLAWMKKWKHAM